MEKTAKKELTPLQSWFKRTAKKAPFYLYETKPTARTWGFVGKTYTVIWREGVKTKIGTLEDGMSARYGIRTYGVLTGTSLSGLWQASPGHVSEAELEALVRVASGTTTLPEFDITTLKGLDW